jgi:hypothetical protein
MSWHYDTTENILKSHGANSNTFQNCTENPNSYKTQPMPMPLTDASFAFHSCEYVIPNEDSEGNMLAREHASVTRAN